MQQRIMIKVYDYDQKGKNTIITIVVLVTWKMLRLIKDEKFVHLLQNMGLQKVRIYAIAVFTLSRF